MLESEPKQPLISVIVVTYNSSKYVLETLESVKAQTYANMELIISDDSSKDGTIEICRAWIEVNQDHFVRTRLILSAQNSGVAPNCNRGLEEAKGEWVKFIAGDDILTVDSISNFVNFAQKNPEANFIFGSVVPFNTDLNYEPILAPEEFVSATAQKQHKLLLTKGNCILGPASFMRRAVIQSLGGFDIRMPMQEDYPFWVKVTGLNQKLHFYDFKCAKYRIHSESLTSSSLMNDEVNPEFSRSLYLTRSLVIVPHLLRGKLYIHYLHHKMLIWRNNKKGSGINRLLRYISYFFDPLGIYIKMLDVRGIKYGYHFQYIRKN